MPQPLTIRRFCVLLVLFSGTIASIGCGRLLYRFSSPVPPTVIPNPAMMPPNDPQFVWSQVVDTVDDYFRIVREQPLDNSGQIGLEGRLETSYRTGSSIFEPWRKDSTKGFERVQSTLQSIRRRATVVVRPEPAGYSVMVRVEKEIEDVDREQFASESAASFRHDGTVVRAEDIAGEEPTTLGWISLGRDTTLEQQIIQAIIARTTTPDHRGLLHH